ncbi:N-acyl homoserine lactonase family protein [Alloalcanivorax mobilis]|uniref:N-acyl homoserine lactonase family protein n=1 Tax=Alloalcanivorax mobilis TaxID=2019569 RepID=UPI000C76F3C9|nr:N-acyl homoserine lactonase family protein [Alloalcanivorax mobilis]
MSLPEYEVFAVRMASAERRAPDNFLTRDVHDGIMPLDFYIWVLRHAGHLVVVDTAFSAHSSQRRKRSLEVTPEQALQALGHPPGEVDDVIITHLHYDHAGGLASFPQAPLHIQDREVAFATGRHMCHSSLNHFFEVEDVVAMVREVYAGRVRFHDGETRLAPGLSLHRVGGHTDGLQVVRVHTRRGWLVLASDALHYYQNLERRNPFPAIFHVGDMLEGYDLIERLADSPDHIIPGHDPAVRERYPRLTVPDLDIAVLHQSPV